MMWYGRGGMMDGGFGLLGLLITVAILIDLVLLGLWLWKQINKK